MSNKDNLPSAFENNIYNLPKDSNSFAAVSPPPVKQSAPYTYLNTLRYNNSNIYNAALQMIDNDKTFKNGEIADINNKLELLNAMVIQERKREKAYIQYHIENLKKILEMQKFNPRDNRNNQLGTEHFQKLLKQLEKNLRDYQNNLKNEKKANNIFIIIRSFNEILSGLEQYKIRVANFKQLNDEEYDQVRLNLTNMQTMFNTMTQTGNAQIQIELTPQQQAALAKATGKEVKNLKSTFPTVFRTAFFRLIEDSIDDIAVMLIKYYDKMFAERGGDPLTTLSILLTPIWTDFSSQFFPYYLNLRAQEKYKNHPDDALIDIISAKRSDNKMITDYINWYKKNSNIFAQLTTRTLDLDLENITQLQQISTQELDNYQTTSSGAITSNQKRSDARNTRTDMQAATKVENKLCAAIQNIILNDNLPSDQRSRYYKIQKKLISGITIKSSNGNPNLSFYHRFAEILTATMNGKRGFNIGASSGATDTIILDISSVLGNGDQFQDEIDDILNSLMRDQKSQLTLEEIQQITGMRDNNARQLAEIQKDIKKIEKHKVWDKNYHSKMKQTYDKFIEDTEKMIEEGKKGFIIHESTKAYRSFESEGNSINKMHGREMKLSSAIEEFRIMFKRASYNPTQTSTFDSKWITWYSYNIAKGAVGEGYKDPLQRYLASMANYIMFDDYSSIINNYINLSKKEQDKTTYASHQIHLYHLNDLYIPMSYYLETTYRFLKNQLKLQNNDMLKTELAHIPNIKFSKKTLAYYNGAQKICTVKENNDGTRIESNIADIYNAKRWDLVARESEDITLRISIGSGLLNLASILNQHFTS